MDCNVVRRYYWTLLTGDMEPERAGEVREHRRTCRSCLEDYVCILELMRGLKPRAAPSPSAAWITPTEKVLDRIGREKPTAGFWRWLVALALAGSLVLGKTLIQQNPEQQPTVKPLTTPTDIDMQDTVYASGRTS